MILNEQELINAICLHTAERRGVRPEDVDVQLQYDEETGFSAELQANGRTWYIVEANMLEAVERYLLNERGIRVYRNQIELDVEDEMIARIQL
jgi:hypothetical protein